MACQAGAGPLRGPGGALQLGDGPVDDVGAGGILGVIPQGVDPGPVVAVLHLGGHAVQVVVLGKAEHGVGGGVVQAELVQPVGGLPGGQGRVVGVGLGDAGLGNCP